MKAEQRLRDALAFEQEREVANKRLKDAAMALEEAVGVMRMLQSPDYAHLRKFNIEGVPDELESWVAELRRVASRLAKGRVRVDCDGVPIRGA